MADTGSKARLRGLWVAGGALAAGLFAYRPLVLGAFESRALRSFEGWFFAPDEKAPLFAVGVAGWMLWRRWGELAALPGARASAEAAVLLAVGAALFVWAQLTRTADLLLPSLSANLLAFGCAARGRAGARVLSLPAVVLLLGVSIPGPIRSELVWQLQIWSAQSAAWVLETAGREVALSGVQLVHGPFGFTVIDSCSGLRGIEILLLVAFAIRELFAGSGRRQWLLVAVAPLLGFLLNVLRIASVVVSTSGFDPAQGAWDHNYQGVAVLAVGTALLYGLGWWMASARGALRRSTPESSTRAAEAPRWAPAAASLAVLAAASVALPPFPPPSGGAEWVELPRSHAGWEGEDLPLDPAYFGPLYASQAVHRRYQKQRPDRAPLSIEIFVGAEIPGGPAERIFSSGQATRPGPDWSLRDRRPTEIWSLRVAGERTVASRRSELALVYTWRLRDHGVLWHAQRSLLGLDRTPLPRGRARVVVRLATPLASESPAALERSKRTLDRFVEDFARQLATL